MSSMYATARIRAISALRACLLRPYVDSESCTAVEKVCTELSGISVGGGKCVGRRFGL